MKARARRSLWLVLVLSTAACGDSCGDDPAPPTKPSATVADPDPTPIGRALTYLATTKDELGLDVVLAVRVYGERKNDPRALRVAADRRDDLRAQEVERYGRLLDAPLPSFPEASLEGARPGPIPPSPNANRPDERVQRCPREVLECRVDEDCASWVRLDDRGGYELTHQAQWLLFAHWMGCETVVDLEARRRVIAARLLLESRRAPAPSDLEAERLAMIGHLGFASDLPAERFERLLELQREEGCFAMRPGEPCHPHPTGMALWALAFAPQP